MGKPYRIAIDVMSGDRGVETLVEAVAIVIKKHHDTHLLLVGDAALINAQLSQHKLSEHDRIDVHHASEVVEMDEAPASALRGKKDSSMRVAINLVKEKQADACVSAGNTGALMATARFVLKMISGIERPAICTQIPNAKGSSFMLDLGANIDSEASHLEQFALMGEMLCRLVSGVKQPVVKLLNIGEEEIKGNEAIKQANERLKQQPINYQGYIEGDGIFRGEADVVVCDGFIGNVSLKTSEGLAAMVSAELRAGFTSSLYGRFVGVLAMPILKQFKRRFDHREYNGASLLGLQGVVIKSHGSADAQSFSNAIEFARKEAIANVPEHIAQNI